MKKIKHNFLGQIYCSEIAIYPLVFAKIKKIFIHVNDKVKENELLIEFDSGLIDNQIKQLQAFLNYEKEKENVLKINENRCLEEYLNYKKEKNDDKNELNNRLKQLESIQSEHNLQLKKILKIEAELSYCNEKKKNYYIYSPGIGCVQNIFVKSSQNVSSNEKLLTITQPENVWIEVNLPVSKYRIGDDFNISIEDYPQGMFKGKIFAISKGDSRKYVEVKVSVNQLKEKPSETTYSFQNGMRAYLKHE